MLELFLLGGVLLAIFSIGYHTVRTGISPVPTTPGVRRTLLGLLPEHCEGQLYELGSGWGGLALALGRRYPEARVEAYEVSLLPWLVSVMRRRLSQVRNLRVHRGDFYRADLAPARLVVCYLYPGAMRRLRDKFERELPDGCVVVSNFFAIPGWTPVRTCRAEDLEASPVYVYRVPDSYRDRDS